MLRNKRFLFRERQRSGAREGLRVGEKEQQNHFVISFQIAL